MKYTFRSAVLFCLALSWPLSTLSDQSNQLGQAAGRLVTATYLMEEFSKTDCGYVIEEEYELKAIIRKIEKELSASDTEAFKAFVQSPEFKKEMEKTRVKLIEEPMAHVAAEPELDQEKVCENLAAGFKRIVDLSQASWNAMQ